MMKISMFVIIGATLAAIGCSRSSDNQLTQVVVNREITEANPIPGSVSGPWVEPMYDAVEIPGQIDPANTYYRVPHRTVIEVRPDRYQEVQYPPAPSAGQPDKK